MGGGAYGFPESETPYLDACAQRSIANPPPHPFEVPAERLQQYQNARLEEHVRAMSSALGADPDQVRNALIEAGLWLCPVRQVLPTVGESP